MSYLITSRGSGKSESTQTMGTIISRRPKRNLERVRLAILELKQWMNEEKDNRTKCRIAEAGLALNDLLFANELEN